MVIVAEKVHYVINGSVVNPFLKGKQGNLFNVGREANSGKGELFTQLLIQQLGRNHDTNSVIQLKLFLFERHYESREVSSR